MAAALLAGCNPRIPADAVISEKALFDRSDARGQPMLKGGTWLRWRSGNDCAVDESQPLKAWPECAESWPVGRLGGQAQTLFPGPDHRLAAGDPLIVQHEVKDPEAGTSKFWFEGGRVTRTDERGRATELHFWPVVCSRDGGKAASDDPAVADRERLARPPMAPGLVERDAHCLASDQKTVRGAASMAEAWAEAPEVLHWVRSTYH